MEIQSSVWDCNNFVPLSQVAVQIFPDLGFFFIIQDFIFRSINKVWGSNSSRSIDLRMDIHVYQKKVLCCLNCEKFQFVCIPFTSLKWQTAILIGLCFFNCHLSVSVRVSLYVRLTMCVRVSLYVRVSLCVRMTMCVRVSLYVRITVRVLVSPHFNFWTIITKFRPMMSRDLVYRNDVGSWGSEKTRIFKAFFCVLRNYKMAVMHL
jgi:hypothetical protein